MFNILKEYEMEKILLCEHLKKNKEVKRGSEQRVKGNTFLTY